MTLARRPSTRRTVNNIPVLPMKRDGVQGKRIDIRLIRTEDRWYVTALDEEGLQVTPSREPCDDVLDALSWVTEALRHLERGSYK